MVIFIDDILFYSISYLEHEQHLRQVLKTLRDHHLYAKLIICEFWLKEVVFLGHLIFVDEIFIELRKVKVVLKWEKPANVIEIYSFLGLARYYRRFIKGSNSIDSND